MQKVFHVFHCGCGAHAARTLPRLVSCTLLFVWVIMSWQASMVHSMVRMIWEKEIDVVVCLTKLQQGKKRKCERYWPDNEDEPFVTGEFRQTLTSVEYGNGLVK